MRARPGGRRTAARPRSSPARGRKKSPKKSPEAMPSGLFFFDRLGLTSGDASDGSDDSMPAIIGIRARHIGIAWAVVIVAVARTIIRA